MMESKKKRKKKKTFGTPHDIREKPRKKQQLAFQKVSHLLDASSVAMIGSFMTLLPEEKQGR